jgi:hypothetical protein
VKSPSISQGFSLSIFEQDFLKDFFNTTQSQTSLGRERKLKTINFHPLAKLSVHIGPHLAVRPIENFNLSMRILPAAASILNFISKYQKPLMR